MCIKVKNIFVTFVAVLIVSAETMGQPIDEARFISLGGIEQWITISGEDTTRPAILFLHGGPGNVMSPYAEAIYGGWKNDFVLVNWDQRGAGRTFGRNAPEQVTEDYWLEHPLTVDRMVDDGIELSEYLLRHLKKRKIILIGTSWGSILGATMALKRPELFHAYIGHAQFVNFGKNLEFSYQKLSELLSSSGNNPALQQLHAMGPPPYGDARQLGQFLRMVKHHEGERETPAPDRWWQLASEYDNGKDSRDRYNGDDYSFLYFAGHEKLGIKSMAKEIDFHRDVFEVPVFIVQGEHDILTPKELNIPWFDKLDAPEKKYFLVPGAAHGHNEAIVQTQYEILKRWITK